MSTLVVALNRILKELQEYLVTVRGNRWNHGAVLFLVTNRKSIKYILWSPRNLYNNEEIKLRFGLKKKESLSLLGRILVIIAPDGGVLNKETNEKKHLNPQWESSETMALRNIRNPWRESWESASEWVPYYWRSLGGSIGATPYRSTSRRPGRVANQATTATKKPMLMSIMFRCRHPRHHSINPFSIPKTDIFWKKNYLGKDY